MLARALMVALLLSHILPLTASPLEATTTPELNYECSVNEDGFAIISAAFSDPRPSASADFWMLVPKNASEYQITTISGEITSQRLLSAASAGGGEYVFYSNLSIQYAGPLELNVKWNMSYASLVVEPNAFFFSPAIGFSPGVRTRFKVMLPGSMSYVTQMSHTPVSRSGSTFVFEPENHDRIAMAYVVSGPAQDVEITSTHFRFEVPKRYEQIGRRLSSFYEDASRPLDALFNTSLTEVNVRFFVPSTLSDISTAGFVPIESAYRLGTIYLNVFYVRTERGYMEAIAAHELVHHYLATSGVAPDVLWFHEGMANYVGIKVSELSGTGGAGLARDLAGEASALPPSSRSFVLSWTLDHTDEHYTLYQHYAAAYYLVSTLAEQMSSPNDEIIRGQVYFESLFTRIRQLSTGIADNGQLAQTMYAAANFSDAAYVAITSIGLKVKPVLVGLGGFTSSPRPVAAYLIYLILQEPVDSAIEAAAAADTSAALVLMEEVNDLLANLDNSLLVLLSLLVMALVVMSHPGAGRPVRTAVA
jgi:hypothetical protein